MRAKERHCHHVFFYIVSFASERTLIQGIFLKGSIMIDVWMEFNLCKYTYKFNTFEPSTAY